MIRHVDRRLARVIAVLACFAWCTRPAPARATSAASPVTTAQQSTTRGTPDSTPVIPDRSHVVLDDIAAAEAEGATYPHGDVRDAQPGFSRSAEAGTVDRKCVDVKDSRAVVSGDFAAGPFDLFRQSWQQGRTKLWWAPQHLADARPRDLGDADGMLMRRTRLDQPGHTVYRYGGLVRSIPDGVGFFNSGAWLPSSGRWMLVTTFAANWGCFVVDAQ